MLDTRVADSVFAGEMAYVATESTDQIVSEGKAGDIAAAESFVLVRRGAAWKIRHLHYSGNRLDKPAH